MTQLTHKSNSLRALALAVIALQPLILNAQTSAPMDTPSTNVAPTAPATPAPVAAPSPTPAPAPSDATATSTERPSTYTIVKGDSLWTVAHKFGTTVVKLRKANNLKKGALLHPGQVLQIPPAIESTAK